MFDRLPVMHPLTSMEAREVYDQCAARLQHPSYFTQERSGVGYVFQNVMHRDDVEVVGREVNIRKRTDVRVRSVRLLGQILPPRVDTACPCLYDERVVTCANVQQGTLRQAVRVEPLTCDVPVMPQGMRVDAVVVLRAVPVGVTHCIEVYGLPEHATRAPQHR